MYCFFKRCYDNEEQFKQCLHFARRLFEVSPLGMSSCKREEQALVVECMPNVRWGCGKDDDLRAFSAKVEEAYAAKAAATTNGAAVAEGGALNIVHICKRMLAARTVSARSRAPSWRSSRTFPTTTTSATCARSRWGSIRCSTCWTPRPARSRAWTTWTSRCSRRSGSLSDSLLEEEPPVLERTLSEPPFLLLSWTVTVSLLRSPFHLCLGAVCQSTTSSTRQA